ncbi:MAG: glycosyltransferase [Candidatus Saccharimonadaceae bacterium]
MRIGLFTDTYRPTINGIVFVVETLKKHLEAQGHEVYVFCPAKTISPSKRAVQTAEDDHIIHFPSVRSGFFDDFDFSLFFPPIVVKQIKELDLDIIHIFTPSQVGLLGINAAVKNKIPFVVQHCTDLYEFAEHYPNVLPGVLALVGIVFPMTVKMKGKDIKEIIKLYRPRAGRTKWNQQIIERGITLLYSKADAVIALCRKSKKQLEGWQDEHYRYDLTLMPNGVDALPEPSEEAVEEFRNRWGLTKKDEIYGFVGRLGEEKNLPVLIRAFDKVAKARPNAKLLFVGDFDYRETLEAMAAKTRHPDRIIFTGSIPREQLGVAYSVLDVFAFPSLKDTQGWVLHEAAHAKLPIVLIDQGVSEVVRDGENGYFAKNNPTDFARKVIDLLGSPTKRAKFGERSKQLALGFTEKEQTVRLVKLYEQTIEQHQAKLIDANS